MAQRTAACSARSTGTCGSWRSCIQGLTKCPTVAPGTVTWKARPEPSACLQDIYHQGEELTFCNFTSNTLDFKVACHTAGYSKGTILELNLLEGFQLDDVSVHPRESEALLPPNKRFAVPSAPMTKRVSGPHGEDAPPPKKKTQCKNPSYSNAKRQPGAGERHQAPAADCRAPCHMLGLPALARLADSATALARSAPGSARKGSVEPAAVFKRLVGSRGTKT